MIKSVVITISACALLTACSNVTSTKPSKYDISSINFFKSDPPKKGENRVYPLALTFGYLVLKNDCIYLTNKKDSSENLRIVNWPWNYSLKSSETGVHIIDGEGHVAAKIGSFVELGGSGGSLKNVSIKPDHKYHTCMGGNVTGAWGASPNFRRSLDIGRPETRGILEKAMKNR